MEWKLIKEQAQINSAESQEKHAEYHKKKKKIKIYEIGQMVLREIPLRSGKLESRYEGPYEIIDEIEALHILSEKKTPMVMEC